MTREEFVTAVVTVRRHTVDTDRRYPSASYRAYFANLFRSYLTSLGCTPDMADWAAGHLLDDLIGRHVVISQRSAGYVADELERMVRA